MQYFFVSDVHLGLDLEGYSAVEREERFIVWLSFVESELLKDGGALFLLGDIFDFWFEVKEYMPTRYINVVAKLRSMTLNGVDIEFFRGNHDTWCNGLFETIGIKVNSGVVTKELLGKRVVLGHGHGVNIEESSLSYRLLYSIFNSKVAYAICSRLVHPDLLYKFGNLWSRSSRLSKKISHQFRGESEMVVKFARKMIKETPDIDYFVFGHLHTPITYQLTNVSTLYILGEWLNKPLYGVLSDSGYKQVSL